MRNIFFISDTHFNHANILKFKDGKGNNIRNFSSVSEMNEHMIEKWNSVVSDGDHIYHLGDVYFGNNGDASKILSRLNGRKRLLVGNHDHLEDRCLINHFKKICLWRIFRDQKIICSHVPLHPDTISERVDKGFINIHGHTHQNGSPEGPYKSVCVEMVDYTPVHIEDIRRL